jgi:predicted Zn-dependent protease
MVAIATMLTATFLPVSGSQTATQANVESRLMAADSGHTLPIANNLSSSANFVASAIAIRHWAKPELTVHVTPSENDNKTPEQVVAAVGEGLNLWNGRFKMVTLKLTDSATADIQIGFVTPGTLPGGAVGKTDTQFNPENDEIAHANIRINERLPQAQLVQAVGHEMGHALGIQGHSPVKTDLMYPYAHLPVEVTDRDLNTLAHGYANVGNTTTDANAATK